MQRLQLCKQKFVRAHMYPQREGGRQEKVRRKQENKGKSDYTHTLPHHSWKMKSYLWRKPYNCRTCGFHVFHVLCPLHHNSKIDRWAYEESLHSSQPVRRPFLHRCHLPVARLFRLSSSPSLSTFPFLPTILTHSIAIQAGLPHVYFLVYCYHLLPAQHTHTHKHHARS